MARYGYSEFFVPIDSTEIKDSIVRKMMPPNSILETQCNLLSRPLPSGCMQLLVTVEQAVMFVEPF